MALEQERWDELRSFCWAEGGLPGEGAEDAKGVDWGDLKLLVVGAGGLGCEILKDLALVGFKDIEVIDMDTIDLSNLNRQFLFREKDIGKPKAEVAAAFVMDRVPGVQIKAHFGRIEDKDNDFYRQFSCIVLGLDSLTARRWINAKVAELTIWEDCGEESLATPAASIPLVDGGTEGFKGHARVINMGQSACIESTEWMFPPQVAFPMCTLENVPRLPEHCVAYITAKVWKDESPFGEGVDIDGDHQDHIMWIAEKAAARGKAHGIEGITYTFTQGVVKNIIPAIASTNAIIAASCCNEVLKMATSCNPIMDNYFMYNGNSIDNGVYGQIQSFPPDPTCLTSRPPTIIEAERGWTPRELVDKALVNNPNVVNHNYETYQSSAGITLQSAHYGLLLAPATSIVAKEVNETLSSLDLAECEDAAPILIASDPSFWEGQFKMLLRYKDE